MLKKLTVCIAVLLMLLSCAAIAEEPMTLVITENMQFYSGPGYQYTQTAYHNNNPIPGETAQVIGREGDWLLVSFTGYWFTGATPIWYYLPLADAPEFADAPTLTFTPQPNALAVESANVYADPEGLTYDLYIKPDAAGLTVLEYEGSMAYVEAINIYGHLLRGFIRTDDLQQAPDRTALTGAPEGTTVLMRRTELPLTHAPSSQYMTVLMLADDTLVCQYDTLIPDGTAIALATISDSGEMMSNQIIRERDGEEEAVLNFLLPHPDGFSYSYASGDDLSPIHETWFTPEGRKISSATMHIGEGGELETLGTSSFRIATGRTVDAEISGSPIIPLRITPLHADGGTLMEIRRDDYVSGMAECAGHLVLAVGSEHLGEPVTHLLLFNAHAQLISDTVISGPVNDLGIVPGQASQAFLLAHTRGDQWAGYRVSFQDGAVTQTDRELTIPVNRRCALLAASDDALLIALSGVDTQLLLTDGQTASLAAETAGTLIHAASDGQTATLLLMENGVLRTEVYALRLP